MIHFGEVILGGLLLVSGACAESHLTGFSAQGTEPEFAGDCARTSLPSSNLVRDGEITGEVPIWRMDGRNAYFFETGMTIDADGAPNAYNPDNTGLDDLANAGEPGHWVALAVDRTTGRPYLQGPENPFPGYYISMTALWDRSKAPGDPRRFVDATAIPYIVLPHDLAMETGTHLGDFAMVFNPRNGSSSPAIFADIGPSVGEGSIALAENLGIRADARRGGARGGILYLVFPGSGNGEPRPADEIAHEAARLIESLGGPERIAVCAEN
jgi:hypothetical protein